MKYVLLFALLACASVPHYDDSPQFKVTIQNSRISDALAPRFYLVGSGRLSLGIIPDLTDKTVWVDARWLAPDGCMAVIAHFVGGGDWESERFCWVPGERVDVKMLDLLSASSAWSHR